MFESFWIEAQSSNDIPLCQNLSQSRALTLPNSVRSERGEAAAKEKSEARRGGFKSFKEKSHSYNTASGDVDTAASCPGGLANVN